MKQFRVTVKASGLWVQTVIFAENNLMALKLAQAQYGASNVMGMPTQL